MKNLHDVVQALEEIQYFCIQLKPKGPKGEHHHELLLHNLRQAQRYAIGMWNHSNQQ